MTTTEKMQPPLSFGLMLYRWSTDAAGPLADIILDLRLKRGKEDPDRLAERKGVAGADRPDAPVVWIHGASVGESLSVLPVVKRLAELRPDLRFLVTTGTVTSARILSTRLPATAQHQFVPVDRRAYVRAFLDFWQPQLALFIESEFWPNLILETHARGVPMALVNGRISPKSYEKWRRRPATIRKLLNAFEVLIAQDGKNAERLQHLSDGDATSFGNLKLAAPPLPVNADALDELRAAIGARPVWLASSTHPGEEEIIAEAHRRMRVQRPDLLTVIVPRHPERGGAIATLLEEFEMSSARRSKKQPITDDCEIYIADTLGELGLFYRLCDVVLVGGSLVPKGGHNPLEPARLHAAILHGPHTYNFVENYAEMRKSGGAALVRNELDLEASALRLFADEKTRSAMAEAAMKAAEARAEQVLNDIIDTLTPYLPAPVANAAP